MKLSARSRYASRILLELAKHKGSSPMSASTLSQHTGVSVQFVEQILKPLKQSGLTRSVRGAAGGHRLARSAEEITLGEVVRLMEGGIKLTVCCGEKSGDCPRRDGCPTRNAWMTVSSSLERELDSITLSSLLHEEYVCLQGEERVTAGKKSGGRSVGVPVGKAADDGKLPRVVTRKAKSTR